MSLPYLSPDVKRRLQYSQKMISPPDFVKSECVSTLFPIGRGGMSILPGVRARFPSNTSRHRYRFRQRGQHHFYTSPRHGVVVEVCLYVDTKKSASPSKFGVPLTLSTKFIDVVSPISPSFCVLRRKLSTATTGSAQITRGDAT